MKKLFISVILVIILLLPMLSSSAELDPSIFYGTWVMETTETDGSYKLVSFRFLDDGTVYNTVSLFTNGEPAGTAQRIYTWSTSNIGIVIKDHEGRIGSMNLFGNGTLGFSIAEGYTHIGDLSGTFVNKGNNETADLSSVSFDDLAALRDKCQIEMLTRDEWKEVTVSTGAWVVGEDIPAGNYSITLADPKDAANVFLWVDLEHYQSKLGGYTENDMLYGKHISIAKIILNEGNVIRIDGDVIFSPVNGLGF